MAKFLLLNTVWVGNSHRYAGEVVDSALESVATIQAAGGALVPTSTLGAASLNGLISTLRLQGREPYYLSEVALAAVMAASTPAIHFSLNDFRIVDANNLVGAAAANGGLLASDTAPVLAASSKMPTVTWATGSVPNLGAQRSVPPDLDPSVDATLELFVLSGTTDPASFTAQVIWDAAAAVSYTADDTATKSATLHKITATLLASDMPAAGPSNVALMLTPAAHATNTIVLTGARITYARKV